MRRCICLLVSLLLVYLARADEPNLVIVDNDFTGPPDTLSDLRSALMFLANPNVKVLGFTVVTGDGWRDEEVAHLLRLEEIVSRKDLPPVVPGAVTPLANSDDQYVDVIVDHGKDYGAVRLDPNNALIAGQSKLRIVNGIDVSRFKALFVNSMSGLGAKTFSDQ
jgi:inosine-uridine nucleoside N-ribohydrolase